MALREGFHPRGLGYQTPDTRDTADGQHANDGGYAAIAYHPKRAYRTDRPLSRPVAFVKGKAQPLMKVDANLQPGNERIVEEKQPIAKSSIDVASTSKTSLPSAIIPPQTNEHVPLSDVNNQDDENAAKIRKYLRTVSPPRSDMGSLRASPAPTKVHFATPKDADVDDEEDKIVYVPPVRSMFKTSGSVSSSLHPNGDLVLATAPKMEIDQDEDSNQPAEQTKSRRAKAKEKRNKKRESRRARKRSASSSQKSPTTPFVYKSHLINNRTVADIDWGDTEESDALPIGPSLNPMLGNPGPTFMGQSAATSRYHHYPEGDRRARKSRGPRYADDPLVFDADESLLVEDEEEEASGMPSDVELASMAAFVRGAQNLSIGTNQMTIDDLEDEARLRQESEDEENEGWQTAEDTDGSNSDEDASMVIEIQERLLVDEDGSDGLDDLTGSENDLEDLQSSSSKGKGKQRQFASDTDDDDDDEMFNGKDDWNDIEQVLKQHVGGITNGSSKSGLTDRQRKKVYQAVEQGDFTLFDDDDELLALSGRPKGQGKNRRKPRLTEDDLFMDQLQAQWEKDKQRKAQKKRDRLAARLEKQPTKKELKKAKKMGLEPRLKAGVNLHEVHASIQSFLMTPDQPYLTLPPMGKKERVAVHLLAECYYLKSQSKGSGVRRFPMLNRTAHSTLYGVDDGRIQSILRAAHGDLSSLSMDRGPKRKGRTNALLRELQEPGSSSRRLAIQPRNRDGDIVGQDAAQLQDDNVGFRLLAKMGWTEGMQIGRSGGISAPIAAVIKTTRLGLGS